MIKLYELILFSKEPSFLKSLVMNIEYFRVYGRGEKPVKVLFENCSGCCRCTF